MEADISQYLQPALKIAQQAGTSILQLYQKQGSYQVFTKQDGSPLTEADILAHDIIKAGLSKLTPTIPVLSEEDCKISFAERRLWPYYWLVDPIDGTREFINRTDQFAVCIALIAHTQAVLGIIYSPVEDLSFFACQGQKAFKQKAGLKPQVIRKRRWDKNQINITIGPRSKTTRMQEMLNQKFPYEVLRLGSALKFCWIAEGRADLYPCFGAPYEWDTAAGQCILEAAGGKVLDLSNLKPLRYNTKDSLVSPAFIAVGDQSLINNFKLPTIPQPSEIKKMTMKHRVKVAITGAAGQIGYAAIFRIANGDMLGPDTEVELQLIELPNALAALEGVAMELEDCAFPLLKKVTLTSDLNIGMRDANYALLIGAVPRKAGMERSDLLKINGGIFTQQGKAINDNAAKDIRVFVVGNPCNTNCLIAMHNAPDVPQDQFFAMTMLDEKRARSQLAKKAGVENNQISQMAIWGNHSTTQYPDFYNAKINAKPALEVIKDEQWLQNDFIPCVQKRGAAVIAARGASSAASAANAAIASIYHLAHDTPANEWYSIARCSQGEYGIDEGLIFSFPCRTEQTKVKVVTSLEHNAYAKQKIQLTLDELRSERDTVKGLGLIK